MGPLVSAATRFEARERKAAKRPSPLAAGGRAAGLARAVQARAFRGPGLPVAHEDVGRAVGVRGHEVGGRGGEGDEAPVAADRGCVAGTHTPAPGAVHAHALRGPRLPIAHEDVGRGVGVAGYEVAGIGAEGYEAPVAADGGEEGGGVRLASGAVDVGALRGAGLPIVDEDVPGAVSVTGYKVGGHGAEADEAPVGADCRVIAATVGLASGAVHAHALRAPRLPVVYEDVGREVGVAGHQVGGI